MTITYKGHPILVKFISRSSYVTLYGVGHTKIELIENNYYLCNVYSQIGTRETKFHRKLKIHAGYSSGCYVECQGLRCYMNSLLTAEQKANIKYN